MLKLDKIYRCLSYLLINLEPTYLRYVYDSLNKGSLNAENAAALPQGFIGLYEEEFEHSISVNECDENGYFSCYLPSNQNKSVNHTFIYFNETKRHVFLNFFPNNVVKMVRVI